MKRRYILFLDEVEQVHREEVGSKCFYLSRLYKAGYLVPKGFCLTRRAWEFFKESILLGKVESFFGGDLEHSLRVGREIRELILGSVLPEEIVGEVREAIRELSFPLAIRSSGLEEDLPLASFAGIYESVLNVCDEREIWDGLRRCWASLFSEAGVYYRRKKGYFSPRAFQMAVIFQQMIPTCLRGVLFTRDPVMGRQEIVLELYSPSEQEDSEVHFQISRRTLKVIQKKVLSEKEPSCPERLPRELVRLGLELEAFFEAPQDVEWAYFEGKIYILQSRPITSLPKENETVYWTAANSQEVLSEPVSPLTFSFFLPMIERGRRELFQFLDLEEFPKREYLKLFFGRPYFNVNYFRDFLKALEIFPQNLFDTLIFGEELSISDTFHLPPLNKKNLKKLFWCLYLRYRAKVLLETFSKTFLKDIQKLENLPHTDNPKKIWNYIEKNALLAEKALRMHVLGTGLAGVYLLFMGEFLKRQRLDLTKEAWTNLARGIKGIRSAEEGDWILNLAKIALDQPCVGYVLKEVEKGGKEIYLLEEVEGGGKFLQALDNFLKNYGHRSLMEADLAVPRWSENPEFILTAIRKYLDFGVDKLLEKRRANRSIRKYFAFQVRQQLRKGFWAKLFPWKQYLFEHLYLSLEKFLPYRENLKDLALRPLFHIRQGFLKLGEIFTKKKWLSQNEDIFYLEYEDVRQICLQNSFFVPMEKIAKEKRKLENFRKILPPRTIAIGEELTEKTPPMKKCLQGLGCSAGIAKGIARVFKKNIDIQSLLQIQPGEILVIRAADPSMTPLFLVASAVVMEVGGMLSHSVVVAREYGIPCITGVRGATEIIQNGDHLTIDGAKGTVYIEKRVNLSF
ncbi:MAG: hypothetical protein D6805_02185 [Planctomycetota bacterium]|nr:MAG: hypothetical protein D6805_02185 [Planctomycetota bacterium]